MAAPQALLSLLGFNCLDTIINGIALLISFLDYLCHTKIQLVFVFICTLQFWTTCFLALVYILWILLDFLKVKSYNLWTEAALAIHFQCWCQSFVLHNSKKWMANDESANPSLVSDLRGKICSLSAMNIMLTVGFFINVLYHVKTMFLVFKEVISWNDTGICQMPFLHQLRWSWGCLSLCCNHIKYYIDWFSYVEPTSHSWNIFDLFMMSNPFNTHLDLVW